MHRLVPYVRVKGCQTFEAYYELVLCVTLAMSPSKYDLKPSYLGLWG